MEEKNPIQVSERIFRTIECLAQNGPLGLLELSQHLELNKSTVHRILTSLMCMDYVKQEPETLKYYLSFKFCKISNQIIQQNNIISIAHPYIKELAEQTGETVHLVQIEGIHAVYIDKTEAPRSAVRLVSMVGKAIPLYCSGVGKALLADMEDSKIRSIWEKSDIRKLTPHTITDLSKLLDTIAEIRDKGYAVDNEENELGVRCIAVSLKNYREQSSYAISISAPKNRLDDEKAEEYSAYILETKRRIEKDMGVSN